MQVQKRNNQKEPVQFDKITERIRYLLHDGLDKFIDPAIITQKIAERIHDGITTAEIDELASHICAAMITVHPAFGTLAGRIVIDNHQKNTSPNFLHVVKILRANLGPNGESAPLVSKEVEPGKYKVVWNGKENYTGTDSCTYLINKILYGINGEYKKIMQL